MAANVGPQPEPVPSAPSPDYSAKVHQGKLYIGDQEVIVKYGDDLRSDPHELAKMASLLNKHYNTKTLHDELFTPPTGGKLALMHDGIKNLKTDKEITEWRKGYKGPETEEKMIQAHYTRKLSELERSMQQSSDVLRAVGAIGKKYSDTDFKKALGSILSETGVNLDKAVNDGTVMWDPNHPAPSLLHRQQFEGVFSGLQSALRSVTGEGQTTNAQSCREELVALLKEKYGLNFAKELERDTVASKAQPAALADAKGKIKDFLNGLNLPDVDANLNPTVPISHLKLGDRYTPQSQDTRMQALKTKVEQLAKQPNEGSRNLQIYTYRHLMQLWNLNLSPPPFVPPARQAAAAAASSSANSNPDTIVLTPLHPAPLHAATPPPAQRPHELLRQSGAPAAASAQELTAESRAEAAQINSLTFEVFRNEEARAAIAKRAAQGEASVPEPTPEPTLEPTAVQVEDLSQFRTVFQDLITGLNGMDKERRKGLIEEIAREADLEPAEIRYIQKNYDELLKFPKLRNRLENLLKVKEGFQKLSESSKDPARKEESKSYIAELLKCRLDADEVQTLHVTYGSFLTKEQEKGMSERFLASLNPETAESRKPLSTFQSRMQERPEISQPKSPLVEARKRDIEQRQAALDAPPKEPELAPELAKLTQAERDRLTPVGDHLAKTDEAKEPDDVSSNLPHRADMPGMLQRLVARFFRRE